MLYATEIMKKMRRNRHGNLPILTIVAPHTSATNPEVRITLDLAEVEAAVAEADTRIGTVGATTGVQEVAEDSVVVEVEAEEDTAAAKVTEPRTVG